MPQKPFEIPQQLRRLAEENVEQARQLYLQFVDRVTQAMAVWSASSTPQFQQVRERAGEFAKENADAAFALAKEVSQAKDLQELLSLQNSLRTISDAVVCGSDTGIQSTLGTRGSGHSGP